MSTTPPPPPDDAWPTPDAPTAVRSTTETVVQPAPPGPPPEEPGNRIGWGMLIGILLVLLVAAAALAVWLLTRDDNKKQTTTVVVTTQATTGAAAGKVAVPRVIGLKEPQAMAQLTQAGLRPKEVFRPTKKPTNVVVSQSPQEATKVQRGAQVTIVIDSGAPKVAVPDVKRLPVAQAQQKLAAVGLASQLTQVTSTQPAGTVVDEAPPPGTKIAKGSKVTLSVAKAAPVAVPNVVGKTEAEATSALEAAGFKVNVASVPGAPKGQVRAQNPPAGSKAPKGSAVRINVADGSGSAGGGATGTTTTGGGTTTTTTAAPSSATVPDLKGQTLQTAVQQLGQAGLLASVQYVPGTDPLGTVVEQSPAAGQTAKAKSHVTLNVSSGPGQKEQKTVPNAVGQTLQQAVATVNAAGLRLIYQKIPVTTRAQAGKVVEQTPTAGKTAPSNAQVLVYLGAFNG